VGFALFFSFLDLKFRFPVLPLECWTLAMCETLEVLNADFCSIRRQMVLSRFWYGWYGVKLSMLAELASARRIKLTYEPQSPSSTCSRAWAGPP